MPQNDHPAVPGDALRIVCLHSILLYGRRWTPVIHPALTRSRLFDAFLLRAFQHASASPIDMASQIAWQRGGGALWRVSGFLRQVSGICTQAALATGARVRRGRLFSHL